MNERVSDILADDARNWVIRLQDSAFADWDAFAEWLERNPAHLHAYNAALLADEAMADLLRTVPANDAQPASPSRRHFLWGAGGAVAAVLAVVAGWTAFEYRQPVRQEIVTAPGEHRVVALADGSKVELNGGTRLAIVDARAAELIDGEALFEIRHDAAHPFIVKAGDITLQDAGTVFNVVRDDTGLRVAVAEGAVIYQPKADAVRLNPGDALAVASGGKPLVTHAPPGDVGSWRGGQLVYRDATLDRIAADLTRNLGVKVRAGKGTDDVRFTGTVSVQGGPDAVIARIALLTGTRAERAGNGWKLDAIDGAPR